MPDEDDNQPYVTVMAGVYTHFAALMVYDKNIDGYKVGRLGATFSTKEKADIEARAMAFTERVEIR